MTPQESTQPRERSGAGDRVAPWIVQLLLTAVAAFCVVDSARACPELLNHRFTTLQGQPIDLCRHANRPVLVVNTASKCGYTPQFEKLEALHRRFRDRGLLVIGFPSNDFNQELATNREVAEFCRLTYFVEFPMVEQGAVTGPRANPFFRQLSALAGETPRWNFHKYLIAPDARTVYSFRSQVEPDSADIMSRLKPMLK
jgi:glutathione peroxidase